MSSVAHIAQSHHIWSADDLLRYVKELSEDFMGGTEERISWFTIKTSAEALRMFWDALEKDEETQNFFTLQLNYDCDYVTYTFTFRRPGTTHKHFRQSLLAEFKKQLQRYESSTPELRNLTIEFDALVKLRPADARNTPYILGADRRPDLSFWYSDHKFPTAVIEISSHEKSVDLQKLAESYIIESRHEIGMVIGIDLGYLYSDHESNMTTVKPTVSIWEADTEFNEESGETTGICRRTMNAVPFRDNLGNFLEGKLEIAIKRLLPEGIVSMLSFDQRCDYMNISHEKLSRYLDSAKSHEPTNLDVSVPRPTRWDKRTRVVGESSAHRPAKKRRIES